VDGIEFGILRFALDKMIKAIFMPESLFKFFTLRRIESALSTKAKSRENTILLRYIFGKFTEKVFSDPFKTIKNRERLCNHLPKTGYAIAHPSLPITGRKLSHPISIKLIFM
jgi:hypothetical protein